MRIVNINIELISFLALSKHFKFTALFYLHNISRKNYYSNFTHEGTKG